jgi:hypothetical protein
VNAIFATSVSGGNPRLERRLLSAGGDVSDFTIGLLLVILAGTLAGSSSAPIKAMRHLRYEHWSLVSTIVGMVVMPWTVLLLSVDANRALADIPIPVLIRANCFSLAWGIANVLARLCLVRIGFSLSIGLLTGIGLPIGVLVPMFFHGSGLFADAPSLFSRAGLFIVPGILVMLAAVILIARAGFGRDAARPGAGRRDEGSFRGGLVMATVAGFLQVGLSFAFVYSQGPVAGALGANGAGTVAALVGLWAFTLPGGALVNIAHPLWRMWRRNSWREFVKAPGEIWLCLLIGILFGIFVMAMGMGMRLMGVLGASLGFGIHQAMQVASSQTVGIVAGEWRGVPAKPRRQMAAAMLLLLIAVVLFAAGKH